MKTSASRLRRWTRAEYEKLVDTGVFRDDELVADLLPREA